MYLVYSEIYTDFVIHAISTQPNQLRSHLLMSGKAEPNEAASLPSNRSQSSHGVDSDRNYHPKRWNKLSVTSEVETECQRLKGWRRPSLGCGLIVLSEVETLLCAEGEALTRGLLSK